MAQEILLDQEYIPFGLAVAAERDRVGTPEYKFGFNAAVGTTAETIWAQGGAYTWNAAAVLDITSTDNVADNAAGTGALTVTLEGLDANYAAITETVTMTGQTAALTTNSFLRVNRMYVASSGSGNVNAGTIYASSGAQTAGVPDVATTIRATIAADAGQTLQAFYTVPAGKTLYMHAVHASSAATTASTQIDVLTSEDGGPWQTKDRFAVQQGSATYEFKFPRVFNEKTDIEVQGTASTGTTDASASFEFLLMTP